ncbi:GerAB/ArcD/ProY family transporter [Neobacillus sp. FSL H8-0543]|uniref:GerAB/ArcD/ProY family transporter n=1 Tax=Neobacillus sp. FSL H8-0543 TaxID=2954672 RepID=UPI0031595110
MVKINAYQLFVLVVLFEMGSAILVGLGMNAKQDAWIGILMGMAGGVLLFLVYYRLFRFYPDLPLTGYAQKILGKWMGRVLSFIYIIYFIYCAARVLRDFGELLTATIYTETPLFIINSLMILTIIYGVQKGFEVIARTGEIFFIIVYLLAIAGILLITFSGLVHLEYLRPVLENGWKPIIKLVLGQTLTFPFGEMLVFTMFLPLINEPRKVKRVCLFGIILSGINIAFTSAINVATLGGELFSRSPYPLLATISKIELADFIERLDVTFMLYLVIGCFFKITLYYYAAVAGATDIFGIKDHRKIGFPIGLMILFASITIAANYTEHIREGLEVVTIYLHWPLQIFIPCLLLVIAFFRNKKKEISSP